MRTNNSAHPNKHLARTAVTRSGRLVGPSVGVAVIGWWLVEPSVAPCLMAMHKWKSGSLSFGVLWQQSRMTRDSSSSGPPSSLPSFRPSIQLLHPSAVCNTTRVRLMIPGSKRRRTVRTHAEGSGGSAAQQLLMGRRQGRSYL